MKKGKNTNKVILLLSDGQTKYEEDVVKSASDSDIHIYTINVGSEDAGANLKKYAEATDGEKYGFNYEIESGKMKYQNRTIQLGKKKKVRYFLLHSDSTRKDSDNAFT